MLRKCFMAVAKPKVVAISLAVTVPLFVILNRIDGIIAGNSGMGVIYLQLAFIKEYFIPVVASWGTQGMDLFLRTIWLDFLLPPAYALVLSSFYALIVRGGGAASDQAIKKIDLVHFLLPAAAALCDYTENIIHIVILSWRWYSGWMIAAGSTAALIKWALLAYMVLALAARYVKRHGRIVSS